MLAACMMSCSSDDPEVTPDPTKEVYTWTTDAGLKACDHILFDEKDKSDNPARDQIGSGHAEALETQSSSSPASRHSRKAHTS